MEERELLPPPHQEDTRKKQLPDNPGTYVVQVPKDQVYRVPPPENAHIAQTHKNSPPKDPKRSRCCWFFILFFIIFFALFILLGAIFGGLFSMLLSPKDPKFSILRFNLLQAKPHPKYDVTFQLHNSNSNVGILYKDKGTVSLSLRQRQIASGPYPTLHQDPHDTTSFNVTLNASKDLMESAKNLSLTFSLAIHFQARMNLGLLRSGTMKFHVTCKLKLDSFAKTPRILSQQCDTKRH
ncbi:NDR1/HIN1-like protein 13 [Cajanus cajan]|uniref:Late embryogenesis abundant protein LEA-2 subgroup domain-containing protein n=1 Tax=Cajanus cajan TaxID=3821 RepID=A0A151SDJ5_CAJCA|nr:NDR1/HIN1-like protein 13 [Cajanus cajan]KYP52839.1 hypothetical protein KK1_025225 [Cajanus cajan]